MSGTAGSEIRSGIGARLKAARERSGLTLLQMAEKLHVDPKVVEALEAGRFEEIGAAVYSKGHIKRYSELTGEDTAQLLDLYATSSKPVMPDLTQLPKANHHADPRKLLLPSLVVLIAFALIGSVWWVLQNFESAPVQPQAVPVTSDDAASASGEVASSEQSTSGSTESPPASSTSTEPRPASGTSTEPPAPPATRRLRALDSEGATSTQPHELAQPSRAPVTQAPPSRASVPQTPPRQVRSNGTRAGTSAGAVSPTQITKTTPLPAGVAADAPRLKSVNVTLKFKSDSWVEVYDANGQRLFYDIGSANSSRAVSGTPPLRVVLGNAPAVSLNINGKATRVPASVVQADSAQFTINRSGRIVRERPDGAASPARNPNGE